MLTLSHQIRVPCITLHAPVTFDQPLYLITVEILEHHKSELKSLFIRIGGFHTAMAFMGAIGTIIADSGLEDIWDTVYAPNTAEHMQTGHDYARALRAHILSSAAITKHILDQSSEIYDVHVEKQVETINIHS